MKHVNFLFTLDSFCPGRFAKVGRMTNPVFAKSMKSLRPLLLLELFKSPIDRLGLAMDSSTSLPFHAHLIPRCPLLSWLPRLGESRPWQTGALRLLSRHNIGTETSGSYWQWIKHERAKRRRAKSREVPVIDLNGFYQAAHGDTSNLRYVQVQRPGLPDLIGNRW